MKIPKPNTLQSKVDIGATEEMKCDECEGVFFNETYYIRRVSKLLSGESQDSIIPIPTMRCADCGHVNDYFKPKGI